MSATQLTGRLAAIGLWHPKDAGNVGAVLRAVGCFGAALVAIEGARYSRKSSDTSAVYRSVPLIHAESLREVIPFNCVPVAVELTATARPLTTYAHPKQAFYVFGPEDGTLGKDVLGWCRDVIQVPTNGCLNLAATVNIVLYDRMTKDSPR